MDLFTTPLQNSRRKELTSAQLISRHKKVPQLLGLWSLFVVLLDRLHEPSFSNINKVLQSLANKFRGFYFQQATDPSVFHQQAREVDLLFRDLGFLGKTRVNFEGIVCFSGPDIPNTGNIVEV